MNFKKGFTLIELLVVIAIIAILAAILFPVFAQAREKARQTSCLSNLKQLGTATQLYVDDYEESYPLAGLPLNISNVASEYPCKQFPAVCLYSYKDANIGQYWTWMDSIFPYVKNINMYSCPSGWKQNGKGVNSYGINENMCNTTCLEAFQEQFATYIQGGTPSVSINPCSVSQIPATAKLVMYVDTNCFNNGTNKFGFITVFPYLLYQASSYKQKESGNASLPANRHNGGVNICFADGHSKYYKVSGAVTDNTDPTHWGNYSDSNRGTKSSWWNPYWTTD